MQDEELMLAVGRGNLQAFEQIVRRYQKSAWNTAYRFLGQSSEAEDMVQDAFLKILNAAPRYRPSAAFQTYFYRVLIRLCLDRIRKKLPIQTDNFPESPNPEPNPPELLINHERSHAVRTALADLPPNQRIAIILKYYQSFSYNQIALALDISEKAVERLLARGRASLAKKLENFFEK